MTPPTSSGSWLRPRLAVLSDRRPAPGAPRTSLDTAIEWALREHDGIWLSGPGEEPADAGVDEPAGTIEPAAGELARWSVLDDAAPPPGPPADAWAAYVRANASYAERIIEVVSPGGMVWIHGERWLLVASALRDLGHHGPLGLVLAAAFPPPARLESLPWSADIMAALCQFDLIAFRAPEHAANFEACRARTGRHRPSAVVVPDCPPGGDGAPARWAAELLQLLGSAARREPRRGFIE